MRQGDWSGERVTGEQSASHGLVGELLLTVENISSQQMSLFRCVELMLERQLVYHHSKP
jgi:hypothetical protein